LGHFLIPAEIASDHPYPMGDLKTVAIPPWGGRRRRKAVIFAGKTGLRAACPAAQTTLYVRPPAMGLDRGGSQGGAADQLPKALIW